MTASKSLNVKTQPGKNSIQLPWLTWKPDLAESCHEVSKIREYANSSGMEFHDHACFRYKSNWMAGSVQTI